MSQRLIYRLALVIRNFALFLLLFGTLAVSAQTADDCTEDSAVLILDAFELLEEEPPFVRRVNRTYCLSTDLPLNLDNGLGTVKFTSDFPDGYPFSLYITDLVTNIKDTLSESGDSVLINEGQLYFVEIIPLRAGIGEITLIPIPILVALGAEPIMIELEVIDVACPTPVELFTCANQNYSQVRDNLSTFEFSTDDEAYPDGGDWRINGLSYETYSAASLNANEGILRFEIPQGDTYDICYETLEEDGCSNYCCQTYCLDANPSSDIIDFTLAPGGNGYNLTFGLRAATSISYYGGEPFTEGQGPNIFIPFPESDCYFTDYTFRYRERDCWRTARTQIFICNPYDCSDIAYAFDRQSESWDLSFTADNASSITWIDDDNEGATLANETTALSIDPRPDEQCGLRSVSIRYFDGMNWRYCSLRFWDCNPYDCADFTAQTNEAGEALNLTFTGADATQITWEDDDTGQNIPDSGDQTTIPLTWPVTGCQTRSISVRYLDTVLKVIRLCAIEVEVCRPEPCDEPTTSFFCGNQQFYQAGINGGSVFTFSTTDPAYPDLGDWVVNGSIFDEVSYASLLPDGTLQCGFPSEGSYEICYLTVDEDGCENYCCRSYCVDFSPPEEITTFEIADDEQGYELTLSLPGAREVSWYVPGQPELEGDGRSIDIPFPSGGCFYRTYYFRYFENDCWKTAIRRVFVCNPFNCDDVAYTFDPQGETWDLEFTAVNANAVTWIDDDNGGITFATGTNAISIDPRPEAQCGVRNLSVRYFNGLGWRFCSFRFWDCNPYDCNNFTTRENEADEALDLIFTGANATQITWRDDALGQNLPNNNGQTTLALAWPNDGCQTRFITVRYFDSALDILRDCSIEVAVCRPEQCSSGDIVENCNDFTYVRSGLSNYSFTSSGEVAENESWLINRVPNSAVGYPATTTSSTLDVVFPEAGTYEICYPFLDEGGCVDYCCKEYCIDIVSNEATIDFSYESNAERYRLRLDVEGAQQVNWYYLNDSGNVQESGSEDIAYVAVPAAGNCFTRTYYFSYLDASDCPRVAFRRVRICDPLICGNISFVYDRANNEYDLTFTGNALAGSLRWLDNDAGGAPLNSTTEQQSIPLTPGACGPRNVSIRYFDGTSWNICGLRYWNCDPYQCNDLTATDDPNNEQYNFAFTGTDAAAEISWQDDVSGSEIAGSNGQRAVTLPYPEQGCVSRSLSIRYFDPGFGGYRLCGIEQEICRPQVCDAPVFNSNCNNQDYFLLEDGNYRFNSSSTVASGESWLLNGEPAGQAGNSLTLSLPVAGTYEVCYPFLDGNGCLNYCCRTYCIEADAEPAVDFGYENNGEPLRLELTEQEATMVDWYRYENEVRTSLGNGQVITQITQPDCGYITYYVRYFSGDCWKVNTRTVWVCNPLSCGEIDYTYNQVSEGFDLELTAGGMVSGISWQDDDSGATLNGNGRTLLLPLEDDCRYRNVIVRYFDGTGWRVCGLRLYVCDPYDCGDVSYGFAPDSEVIEFELTGVNNATEISWMDDDSGQALPGDGASTTLIWDGDCRARNISVRYRDPVADGWRVCGFRFFACAPRACESFISFEEGENNEVLISTDDSFTQLRWTVEGADAGAENVLSTVILPGESRTVCVQYFDPANGYFRTCCRTITIPECPQPVAAFRVERNLDTISVVNEAPDADATYLWDFGGLSTSTLPQPSPLHLPPGRYLICLEVTNACGFQRTCQEVLVPDLANNLILELGDVECGPAGEIVTVPLSVRNFTDITSFQFSLSLPTPRYGRFRGMRFQSEDGTGVHMVLTDSTLTASWVRTNTMSNAIADGTVIGLVDIQLTGNEGGTGAVAFSDTPAARNFEYTDGQAGLPGTVDGSYELCLPTGSISGRIRTETGDGIGQVIVLLERNGLNIQSLTTDATGNYRFIGLQPGYTYKVLPIKDINYRNGVTAGDLSRIRQHLFQVPELATPYQRIAADVKAPGQIAPDDISTIRQLIFREVSILEDVDSWKFVPLAYSFPNPDTPHEPAYPEVLNITASKVETGDQDFVGMKMGDIGDSADPATLSNSGPGSEAGVPSDLAFELIGEAPMRGETYRIDVRANNFTDLLAAQFSLGWSNIQLRFDSLSNLNEELELNDQNFSAVNTSSGRLAWLWFAAQTVSLDDSSLLFSAYFTVTGEVGEKLDVSFTEDPTEFSFEDRDTVLIANFTDLEKTIELPTSDRSLTTVKEWRVFPNPATKWITVATIGGGFGPEQLELFDSQGRSVRKWASSTEENYSVAGLPTGVYHLWLSSDIGVQVSRLIILD